MFSESGIRGEIVDAGGDKVNWRRATPPTAAREEVFNIYGLDNTIGASEL
jgi:hypothetical protein